MERYFESLKPFGTADELKNSRKIIDDFKIGVGKKLHAILVERTKTEKNWVEKYWENYAYLTVRSPILPFCSMAQMMVPEAVGVSGTPQNYLHLAVRMMHLSMEFWELIRKERLAPGTSPDGSIVYSSFLLRRFYHTVREPGEVMDKVVSYFKTDKEGGCPTHSLILGRGKIFKFDSLNPDGSIISPQQLLCIFQQVRATLDVTTTEHPVPILTCDDRSQWAQNRLRLQEISENNKEGIYLIESAACVCVLDENSPRDDNEVAQYILAGDLWSRWADKSSVVVAFKNGKIGLIGEHSCYDGTISMYYSFYAMLTLMENPDLDWDIIPERVGKATEIRFDLNEELKEEIDRVLIETEESRHAILVCNDPFYGFGKNYMKAMRLHPDAFIQMVLQLSYFKMHQEFVATYETALMRNYFNGRTETLRSCTSEAIEWSRAMCDPAISDSTKVTLFKRAVENHDRLMKEARKGNGIDRHLFGLWCAAYEADIPIPELYDDVLYNKSGGGGNFVLSTSTLGYSINSGYVGPMCLDGYGVFYSITSETIYMNITAFRKSVKTSSQKFSAMFRDCMLETKNLLDRSSTSKL